MVRFSVVLFCKAITAKLVGNISSEVSYFLTHISYDYATVQQEWRPITFYFSRTFYFSYFTYFPRYLMKTQAFLIIYFQI